MTHFLSGLFTKKDLEKLSIDKLVDLAKSRRSMKHPFKKMLIEYLLKVL